jgi:DNA-binding response OmpR family regulator
VNILLVDDDPHILRIVSRMLTAAGHQVGTCESPFGVAAVVLRTAPDVVVLDVQMPGLSGPMLAGIIARLELPKRPVLCLWSNADEDSLRRAGIEAGGLTTLSKSHKPSELVVLIERIGQARADGV